MHKLKADDGRMEELVRGRDRGRLKRVLARVQRDLDAGRSDGMAVVVSRAGEVVLEAYVSRDDDRDAPPLGPESVFSLMSLSKALTTTLALRLIEDGHFSLTTPISAAVPELCEHWGEVNVYHILTQTSGLPTHTPGATAEVVADMERYVEFIADDRPSVAPGARVAYSVRVAHSVLGLFMQRVLDEPFTSLMNRVVLAPLMLKDTAFGPREDLLPRLVPVVPARYLSGDERAAVLANVEFISDFSLREGAVVPGSNAFSTARDMHALAEALRTGQSADGEMFLSQATLDLVARNHTGSMPNDLMPEMLAGRSLVDDYPANLALGFWGRGETMTQSLFGHLASSSTFGSVGRGSTVLWVDPEAEVSVVALSVGLMNEADNVLRFTALGDVISSSFDRRRSGGAALAATAG